MEIKEYLIEEDTSVLLALKQLDILTRKILFLTRQNRLVAALTDGDIRRWILKNGDMSALVSEVANYSPKYLFIDDIIDPKNYMKKNSIEALPIIDRNHTIVSIEFLHSIPVVTSFDIEVPVVIMAGGLGTRLYPYTKILPKPLIPVGEIPITEHIMDKFAQHGLKSFILIVNHKKNMIKSYFSEIKKDYMISYVDEEIPLGTGGGLSLLKGCINETFILTNCDILIEEDYKKIYDFHIKSKNLITMVCSLKNMKIPYGVINFDDEGNINSMKEKPELSFFVNTGMYIVDKAVIDGMDEKFIGFPDVIEQYRIKGFKVGIYPISEYNWLDMGQLEDLDKMRIKLYGEK